MPEILLPFPIPDAATRKKTDGCNILSLLSKTAQATVAKNPHLLEYLMMIPIDNYGLPKFYETLDRSVASNPNPNLIYPVKDGIFTHILYDHGDGRNTYIPIEPTLLDDMSKLMLDIEKRLLEMADRLGDFSVKTIDEKREAFLKCIDEICVIKGQNAAPARRNIDIKKAINNDLSMAAMSTRSFSDRFKNSGSRATTGLMDKMTFNGKGKLLEVTQRELDEIKYLICRDKVGLGVLDPIVYDKYVEDVSCSGMGVIFLEHKIFKSLKTVINFATSEDLDQFVMRLAERIKKPVSVHSPIVDATLPDGSRINIVYGSDVSKRGSNFTIRKFSDTPLSILELIDMGTLDYKMASYLSLSIGEGMNCFVCGETASGKTTSLNAVTTFIHPNAKIVSIEDTPELQVPHQNWIREVVSGKEGEDAGVNMFDLLKAALRQRPNEIIIGEIRGAEGAIAFQAMQTGHSVMATFHAASVEKLIQRMTGNPINIPKSYMDNLNIVIIQQAVKLPSGKIGRRMTSINEIVGYDPVQQSFTFVEAFHWDPVTDTFQFSGDGNSYILEHKIAPILGIPPHKKRRIYAEVDRRAKILERLNGQGVKNFYDLLKVLAKAQREGLF